MRACVRDSLADGADQAAHPKGADVALKDIAAREDISKKYLEIIVKDMVAGGLLVGVSGKGGGYHSGGVGS